MGRREHEGDEGEDGSQRAKRKFGEGMDVVTVFMVLMMSWVYAYVKAHQIIHSKYVQMYVNRAVF